MNKEEQNYLDLMQNIITNGDEKEDRTGTGTFSLFGTQLKFSLKDNTLPLLTTKKVFIRGAIEELLFFIRGETNTKILENKNVNIWKGNTSRQFLDGRNLHHLEEGSMGKGYGFQWRRFGEDENNKGIDQLANVIDTLKNNPNDRRMIVTAWNPLQLKDMALPPCHMTFQFYAFNGELSCQFYQRSVDFFLGKPLNLVSYSILTHILAKTVGLKAKELTFIGGDTHVYKNHVDQVKLQCSRTPYDFPKLKINKELNNIQDIEQLKFEDFEVIGYNCHPTIFAPMAI